MKKILMFMLVLAMLGVTSVMAQDVTYGADGTFAYNVVGANNSLTLDSDHEAVDPSDPYGLSATGFVVAPWMELTWDDLVVKVSAEADHLDYDDDDSTGFVAMNLKKSDLFGYSGFSLVAQAKQYGDADSDKLEWDDNYFGFQFESDVVTAEVLWHDLWDGVIGDSEMKEATITFDDGKVEAKAAFVDAGAGDFGISEDTYLKFNDLFGMWTVDIAGGGKSLRLADYATGSGYGEFSNENFYYWGDDGAEVWDTGFGGFWDDTSEGAWEYGGDDIDVLNTFGLMDGAFAVKVGTVMPTDDKTIKEWLRGENLFVGAEFAMEGLGVFNAGASVATDYEINAMDDEFHYFTGSKTFWADVDDVQNDAAYVGGDLVTLWTTGTMDYSDYVGPLFDNNKYTIGSDIDGMSFWVDADVSEMMEELTLVASVDGKMSQYWDKKQWAVDLAAGMDGSTSALAWAPTYADLSQINFGVDAGYDVSDAISVSVGLDVSTVSGYDYEVAKNVTWANYLLTIPETANYIASNYDEANYGAMEVAEITPLAVSIGVEYTLSDMIAFSLSNDYTSMAGNFQKIGGDNDVEDNYFNYAGGALGAKDMYGYFGENAIAIGAVITPEENMSFTFDFGYTMFLGLPSSSDLYVTGMSDPLKKAVDATYEEWVDGEFNPWSLSVAYSYSY